MSHDTADTTPSWSDRYTSEELAAALDWHALQIAKRSGRYDIHDELCYAAECIRELQQKVKTLEQAGGDLVRQVMAARESLS